MKYITWLIVALAVAVSSVGAQDSLNVRWLGRADSLHGQGYGMATTENRAYIATGFEPGLEIVDIADATHPVRLGFCSLPSARWDYAVRVALTSHYAYVTTLESRIHVLDVSDPASPVEIATCDSLGMAFGIAIQGTYAYVTNSQGGLNVLDLSNPAVPTLVTRLDWSDDVRCIATAGPLAVTTGWDSLRVISLADPSHPTVSGSCSTPQLGTGIAIQGNLVFATFDSGLSIFDISEPSQPVQISHLDTPGSLMDLQMAGNYGFVADWHGGLRVIDISNPTAPFETGFHVTPGTVEEQGSAGGVVVRGNIAFVADQYYLGVFDCAEAMSTRESHTAVQANFALQPAYPNPFNATTTLRLDLPKNIRARLVVYDALGRRMSTLIDERIPAGSHDIRFDASNLASGTYFVRLESRDLQGIQKVVVIK